MMAKEVSEKIGQLQNADASKKDKPNDVYYKTNCWDLMDDLLMRATEYGADVSKTMMDYQCLKEENCNNLWNIYKDLYKDYHTLIKDYLNLKDVAEMLKQNNAELRRAITSALSYLACMDRISEKESNEQLAMDVLNEALSGCFQNGNTHEEGK